MDIEPLLPLLVGTLTFFAMQYAKRLSAWVDAQTPTTKRLGIVIVAATLTAIGQAAQVDFQCDLDTNCLGALDEDAVKTVASALVAYALHGMKSMRKKG